MIDRDGSFEEQQPAQLVESFFRHETGRLHGALVRLLGIERLHLAEDFAQEAMLRALRVWSMGGIPPNPSAWITRVAMNLARDALRHERMAHAKQPALITHHEQLFPTPAAAWAGSQEIRDDLLRLLFACCHPEIAPDAQVALALKIICGFSVAEIAQAFLSSEAAIEKQLTRTKKRIQTLGAAFEIPEGENLAPRLDGVLGALYLLFNEGYKASRGDRLLREDLCQEAIRLTSLLARHSAGNKPQTHALLALMLLNAARFPSRTDEEGALLRLDDQDRSKWDSAKIDQGLFHLSAAASGEELSHYHLLASIAALHCVAKDAASTDWSRILQRYDTLLSREPSPVIALNRAVAVAHADGPAAALQALENAPDRAKLDRHYLYHAVRGDLQQRLGRHQLAIECFRSALNLAQLGPERDHLTARVRQLEAPPAASPA